MCADAVANSLIKDLPLPQAGHREEWLCSMFSNLTEDLEIALRSAWLATMIVHSQSIRHAEGSVYNRTRQAIATVLGHAADEVTAINHPHGAMYPHASA
jgi:hypothetical protein